MLQKRVGRGSYYQNKKRKKMLYFPTGKSELSTTAGQVVNQCFSDTGKRNIVDVCNKEGYMAAVCILLPGVHSKIRLQWCRQN